MVNELDEQVQNFANMAWYSRMIITFIGDSQIEVTKIIKVEVLPTLQFEPHGNHTMLFMSLVFKILSFIINLLLYVGSTRCAGSSL